MLTNKVVVLSGCCGLLGKSFAKTILKAGGKLAACDINPDELRKMESELVKDFPQNMFSLSVVDITKVEEVKKLISSTKHTFGKIDSLVNNAYPRNKEYGKKTEDVSFESFNENVSLHLGGYFLCMQQFSIFFKEQGFGNVISMSSIYGIMAPRFEIYEGTEMTMPVEYAAIKSGVIQLSKYFAKYYKGYNIRFNCICPGGNRRDDHDTEFVSRYSSFGMTKGLLDKEDLSGTLLFLLSEQSQYINGQNIVVDDGWSL